MMQRYSVSGNTDYLKLRIGVGTEAIGKRRQTKAPLKEPCKRSMAFKADNKRYLDGRQIRVAKQGTCMIKAALQLILMRRNTKCLFE